MAESPQAQEADQYDFVLDGQQLDIDHYDFIDAPQYVDFENMQEQDDPEADKFFETHREEDDFMIALDVNSIQQSVDLNAISPTVQLLYSETHYESGANKAAKDAGLDDVKIEYYASPQQQQQQPLSSSSQPSSANKKSLSAYGTPLGALSGGSSQASFYTPTGEDKENKTPPPRKGSVKAASEKIGSVESKALRGILSERSIEAIGASLNNVSCSNATPELIQKIKTKVDATQSLYSQLEKLHIVSSDEEDLDDVKTPVLELSCENYSTFSTDKLSFLDLEHPVEKVVEQDVATAGAAADLSECSDLEVTQIEPNLEKNEIDEMEPAQQNNNDGYASSASTEEEEEAFSGGMELRTPVRNILRKLNAELSLGDDNALDDDPRCSIVVAPSVGQQVHWNSNNNIALNPTKNILFEDSSFAESHNDINDSIDFDISGTSSIHYNSRRASSVGDLPLAIEMEPKDRNFKTFGYNPRVGITIPKTPDIRDSSFTGISESQNQNPKPEMTSNKNSCYFEIEPPKKSNVRRVSSCSDLYKFQQAKKVVKNAQMTLLSSSKKKLTVPRTPETIKRSRKIWANKTTVSNVSSASSTCSTGAAVRGRIAATKTGPTVAERLAAARSRQPIKANHYVSMAEAMINYQKNTPDRFRTLPKGRVVPEKRSASSDTRRRIGPTPPRSPELSTAARRRNNSMAEHKENDACQSGVPQKVALKTTVPKPFNFSSSHRPRSATVTKNEADVVDFKFKARPAPPKPRVDGPASIKLKPAVKVTQPMSPHFASDDRLKERQQKKVQSAATSPKSKPGKPTAPKLSRIPACSTSLRPKPHADEHKTTIAQPFSSGFEARQKEILRRKEEKIKQELEQEAKMAREFHANPAPKFTSKPLKKKPVEVTHAEPFRLMSDERGAAYQEAFKRKIEEEEERLRELAKFHANPPVVLLKPPFEPEKPSKSFEGPMDIQLATEKRAAEREQFDEHIREKEREEEERRRQEQEMLEELERLEDIERRRQMVHKAQPFKEPKPFQVKTSSKPLTVPQSPAFSALPSVRRIHGQGHTPPKANPQ